MGMQIPNSDVCPDAAHLGSPCADDLAAKRVPLNNAKCP